MGYLSCKAQASVITCRSISGVVELDPGASSSSPGGIVHRGSVGSRGKGKGKGRATADAGGEEEMERGWKGNPAMQGPRRVRVFSYSELEEATAHFSDETLLGRGSHGSVYRAVLRPSGHLVAVKRPSRLQHFHPHHGGSGRFLVVERNEVENEIDILSRIHNPRLVNLVGVSAYEDGIAGEEEAPSCSPSPAAIISSSTSASPSLRRRERLLVVEYMPNGTLYELLHSNPHPPGWVRRLCLALQTAKAIHALHSCAPPVIHRDVKSANVLIDSNFNARLGDFGLALRAADDSDTGELSSSSLSARSASLRSTPPAGTLGYLDPGYITPENLSTKTDVFSFGILLLEIISGRKAIDVAHSPPSVVEWAIPLLRKGKVLALYDPRIPAPKDPAARRQLACLAASCVRSSKEKRPAMEEVIFCLKVLQKSLPPKSWASGISVRNPCLMVEAAESIQMTKPSKPELNDAPLPPLSSEFHECDDAEEREMIAKRSPSSKAIHPLRNLIDLMMAPDAETLKFIGSCPQRSIIRRRAVHRPLDDQDMNPLMNSMRDNDVRSKADELKEKLDVELL